jgi:hypothetical protein
MTCAVSTTRSRIRGSGSSRWLPCQAPRPSRSSVSAPVVAATVVGTTGDISPLPHPRSLRRLQRHRPGRGVLRWLQGVATFAPWEPHAQPRHPHGRRHPDAMTPPSRSGLLRPHDRRRQDTQGSAACPQATHQRCALGGHDHRRSPVQNRRREGGSGRATGERLCRQRGRLTPRTPALRLSHSRTRAKATTTSSRPRRATTRSNTTAPTTA